MRSVFLSFIHLVNVTICVPIRMQIAPNPCYFLRLTNKYCPQHISLSKILNTYSFLKIFNCSLNQIRFVRSTNNTRVDFTGFLIDAHQILQKIGLIIHKYFQRKAIGYYSKCSSLSHIYKDFFQPTTAIKWHYRDFSVLSCGSKTYTTDNSKI